MQFTVVSDAQKRKKADALVLPFFKGKKKAEKACSDMPLGTPVASKALLAPIEAGDFRGKEGELSVVYSSDLEPRVIFLGLGEKDKLTTEFLRRSFAALAEHCQSKRIENVNICVPDLDEDVLEGLPEGLLLKNYRFDELRTPPPNGDGPSLLKKVNLLGATKKFLGKAKWSCGVAEGVYLARDLVNRNADTVNPKGLVACAKDLGKRFPSLKITIFDKKRIEKEGMGLLLAVNRGSKDEPAFIIMEYRGAPKSKDHTVIVGKGVTYDTGGLNLKPTGSIETMRCDMAGAAAVFGTICAAANTGLKRNVTAVVAATENSMDAESYKPGDVYQGYSGKFVEIANTDAEGRLTLADALSYAQDKLKPTRIIDLATLTGAILVALGEETSGLMSNNDDLSAQLTAAGEATYERVWRLPLFEEYKEQNKSDRADIKNTGGRFAGSITAGLFLAEFVENDIPWAHLDIAGTAYLSSARRYNPKMGTGVGVRLLMDFFQKT